MRERLETIAAPEPIQVKHIYTGLDAPERPRDFDVEGHWKHVKVELQRDQQQHGCKSFIVLYEGDGLYVVWRDQ